MIGAASGFVYTSEDSGGTWTEHAGDGSLTAEQPPSCNWGHVAISSDGNTLMTGSGRHTCNGNFNWVAPFSQNGGTTWSRLSDGGGPAAISSNGTRLAKSYGYGNRVSVSQDAGLSWTSVAAINRNGDWRSMACSSDGLRLAAVVTVDYFYGGDPDAGNLLITSTDGGISWTRQHGAGAHSWTSIASSADGLRLALSATSNNFIHTSVDGGVTWSAPDYSPPPLSPPPPKCTLQQLYATNLISGRPAVPNVHPFLFDAGRHS
jgi:photosystem II stability/assembly factor-like uncharacterized protein